MNHRLQILHVVDTLSMGGAEQLILTLAQHIDRRRFELHICALGEMLGNPLREAFQSSGVPLTVLGARSFYDPRTLPRVARYIRRHDIDVVHTHLTHADIVGRFAARLAGRPVVSSLHNQPSNYNRERIDLRLLERLSAKYVASRLVAVSGRIRELFVADWRLPPERIEAIPNAVPMQELLAVPQGRSEVHGGPEPGPVITNIGRLARQKGQADLLAAARLVVDRFPNAQFWIAGQGNLETPLRERAQALGISANVHLLGLRRDIPALLGRSDIFALSSLWEGMPLTVVEAMAAARPMVLTDVGANSELVEHGTHGLIVPPGKPAEMAAALIALLDDPELRRRLGAAARERARQNYSVERYVAQHEQLYTRLASGWPVAPTAKARRPVQAGHDGERYQ